MEIGDSDDIVDSDDEEDVIVAQETDWIVKKNRKSKREAFPSLPSTAAAPTNDGKKNNSNLSSKTVKQTSSQVTNPAKPKRKHQTVIDSHFPDNAQGNASTAKKQVINGTCTNAETATKDSGNAKPEKKIAPPPLRVSEVKDIKDIVKIIDSIPEKGKDFGFTIKTLNNDVIKVFPNSQRTWEKILTAFRSNKLQFVTFENKITRPTKVVIKGLHSSTIPEEIISDLRERGYLAVQAYNVKLTEHRDVELITTLEDPNTGTQDDPNANKKEGNNSKDGDSKEVAPDNVTQPVTQPTTENAANQVKTVNTVKTIVRKKFLKSLPIFHVCFSRDQDIEEIFKIKQILHCKGEILPYHRESDSIPQCLVCQAWGHTRRYCFRRPYCVRCAGGHLSSECPEGRYVEKPKCINCGEQHSANYRGCIVPKELQLIRKKFSTKGKTTDKKTEVNGPPPPKKSTKGTGYANAVNGGKSPLNKNNPTTENLDVNMYLALILSKLESQSNEIQFLKKKIESLESNAQRRR